MNSRLNPPGAARRSLLQLLAIATLAIAGCGGPDYAHRRVDGDTVIFTDHWSTPAVGYVFGLFFIGVGLKPHYDRLRQSEKQPGRRKRGGKQRAAWKLSDVFNWHHLFAIAGAIVFLLTYFSTQYHYVAVTPARFYSHWEKAGRPSLEVDLSDLLELRLTTANVYRRGPRTRMQFIHLDDTRQSDLVSSGAEGAALEYLIEKAPEWGYRVDDRRKKK